MQIPLADLTALSAPGVPRDALERLPATDQRTSTDAARFEQRLRPSRTRSTASDSKPTSRSTNDRQPPDAAPPAPPTTRESGPVVARKETEARPDRYEPRARPGAPPASLATADESPFAPPQTANDATLELDGLESLPEALRQLLEEILREADDEATDATDLSVSDDQAAPSTDVALEGPSPEGPLAPLTEIVAADAVRSDPSLPAVVTTGGPEAVVASPDGASTESNASGVPSTVAAGDTPEGIPTARLTQFIDAAAAEIAASAAIPEGHSTDGAPDRAASSELFESQATAANVDAPVESSQGDASRLAVAPADDVEAIAKASEPAAPRESVALTPRVKPAHVTAHVDPTPAAAAAQNDTGVTGEIAAAFETSGNESDSRGGAPDIEASRRAAPTAHRAGRSSWDGGSTGVGAFAVNGTEPIRASAGVTVERETPAVSSVVATGTGAGMSEAVSTGAIAAPAGERITPDQAARFADRIAEAIQAARSQDNRLSVRLHPPDLGALRIDVVQQGGELTARLEVQSAAAHRLIVETLPQLRESLHHARANVDRIDVQLAEPQRQDRAGGNRRLVDGRRPPHDDRGQRECRQQGRQPSDEQPARPSDEERDGSASDDVGNTGTTLNGIDLDL